MKPLALLSQTRHRPFPYPDGPWFSRQLWKNVLFYNVPVEAANLQAQLPPTMTVDTYDGLGWISIVPFQLAMTLRFLPHGMWPLQFNELNVRTYVTVNGEHGIYFYSLDADDPFSVLMARRLFHLHYFNAEMTVAQTDGQWRFQSRRTHSGSSPGEFDATYGGTGSPVIPEPNTLQNWLTSRWCFFCPHPGGGFVRGDIHHEPWPLQPATISIQQNTLLAGHGLPTPLGEPILYFAKQVHVLAWPAKLIHST